MRAPASKKISALSNALYTAPQEEGHRRPPVAYQQLGFRGAEQLADPLRSEGGHTGGGKRLGKGVGGERGDRRIESYTCPRIKHHK